MEILEQLIIYLFAPLGIVGIYIGVDGLLNRFVRKQRIISGDMYVDGQQMNHGPDPSAPQEAIAPIAILGMSGTMYVQKGE